MNKRKISVLKAVIDREMKNLDSVQSRLQRYQRIFSDLVANGKRDDILDPSDICVLVAVALNDYYLATEKIFRMIAVELDGGLPGGEYWRKQLLTNMSLEVPGVRPPLLEEATALQLDELRRFRCLFHNTYNFALDPARIIELAKKVPNITEHLRGEVAVFCRKIQALYNVSDGNCDPCCQKHL